MLQGCRQKGVIRRPAEAELQHCSKSGAFIGRAQFGTFDVGGKLAEPQDDPANRTAFLSHASSAGWHMETLTDISLASPRCRSTAGEWHGASGEAPTGSRPWAAELGRR